MSAHPASRSSRKDLLRLTVGALGVVFGDIGTSPLYAVRECFKPGTGIPHTDQNVFGILSLVFWALLLVVSVKYVLFVLRADNKGEGGMMALLALLIPKLAQPKEKGQLTGGMVFTILLGLFGTALLYGEGVITPAISVLSAVEGLEVATPAFKPIIVPLTLAILIGVFLVQSRGTARIATIFGPVTLLWFVTIAAIALPWIFRRPEILGAVNPIHGARFFLENGLTGFLVLGSVVLCITGTEALYADMGHFGRGPIRLGWFSIVWPSLILNYLGQGALILDRGEAALVNPFYGLVGGGWAIYPLVAIATAATIIASQALITGTYSLTQQAVQLGYLPRITIRHTSWRAEGQIYVPRVNTLLMVACLWLVVEFKSSTALASAYGVAVTGTMVITSILYSTVKRQVWGMGMLIVVPWLVAALVVDLSFFSANIVKFHTGGWIPIVLAIFVFYLMTTWKKGRQVMATSMLSFSTSLDEFFADLDRDRPPRVKGTAVFMTLLRDIAPSVLLHHYRHSQVLHERVVLLSIVTKNEPSVDTTERVRVTELRHGFHKVIARYGYMETPDIAEILLLCASMGLVIDPAKVSYFLGRESFSMTGGSGLPPWRKRLFIFLSRNARPATDFFGIPPDRVIEIGSQFKI